MARVCDFCGKGTTFGRSIVRRGLAKAKGGVGRKVTGLTRRKFRPNLQSRRIQVGGGVMRVKVCASCLKAGKIEQVIARGRTPKSKAEESPAV